MVLACIAQSPACTNFMLREKTLTHSSDKNKSEPTAYWLGNNDNDNDTLREVPHPSNEGLALQARVSGPWPHKKEYVLLV